MERQLFRLLLNYEWFMANKDKLSRSLFPDDIQPVFDIITQAHEKYKRNLTYAEVKALVFILNPTLTRSAKHAYDELFKGLQLDDEISPTIGKDILDAVWLKERFRQIGELALEGINGETTSIEAIQRLIEDTKISVVPADRTEFVSDDIDALLELTAKDTFKWRFNIDSLARVVPGVGPGNLVIGFGRPNVGKSGLWVSLVYAPGGFAWQGAKVHAIINEEPAVRTQVRGIASATGIPIPELSTRKDEVVPIWRQIKDNIKLVDNADMSMEGLDAYVRKHKPDVLVVDQLDKMKIDGAYARGDERLKAIYVEARGIVKRHNMMFFGVCQASAEAEGKRYLDQSMMENSRTGKPGEADLIFGIGKSPVVEAEGGAESYLRTIGVLKNKLNGEHPYIDCLIDPKLSRYVS